MEDARAAPRPVMLQAAQAADLNHVNDTHPGIRRVRRGRGFSYVTGENERVADRETLDRIAQIVIPPAWSDVWISSDPNGHIQATGRDQRGRKQYRYHPAWSACRDEAKFDSLCDFARRLPVLREQVDADMRRRSLTRERVTASIVWLLDRTLIRIGNDIYAEQNKSFGLTTLTSDHVEASSSGLRFSFTGKSGKAWNLGLQDRRIASAVRRMQELPGERLFQYLDEDGEPHPVHSQDVNAYIKEAIGTDYSSKHFRTWGASSEMAHLLARLDDPETKTARNRLLNTHLDKVAAKLNNTRAVCRRCYVHPAVIEGWEDGTLVPSLSEIRSRYRRPLAGLDLRESQMLRWLERN
jgi:DNA topoisomerase I